MGQVVNARFGLRRILEKDGVKKSIFGLPLKRFISLRRKRQESLFVLRRRETALKKLGDEDLGFEWYFNFTAKYLLKSSSDIMRN
jgi:hypothetical protein